MARRKEWEKRKFTENTCSTTTYLMPPEAIRLFKLLCDLLPAGPTEAVVRQRLKPLTTATSPVRSQLGRTYLTLSGACFQLTAIFEGQARHLYQVTLRVTPPAYTAIKAFARDLPGPPSRRCPERPSGRTAGWACSRGCSYGR